MTQQIGRSGRAVRSRRLIGVTAAIAFTALLAGVGPTAAATPSGRGTGAVSPSGSFAFSWVGPTQAPPALNKARAGTWVGVHFSAGGNLGMDVIPDGWPRDHRVDCQTNQPIPYTLNATDPDPSVALTYDPGTSSYTYAWKPSRDYGSGPARCREFLLKLSDGTVHTLLFRFLSAPTLEPGPNQPCADVVNGDGIYISTDPITTDPLPFPEMRFGLQTAAASCADALYRMYVLPADVNGDPTSHLPIAVGHVQGDGSSTILSITAVIHTSPPPPEVCVYFWVKRGSSIVERAPDHICLPFALDGGSGGHSGWD